MASQQIHNGWISKMAVERADDIDFGVDCQLKYWGVLGIARNQRFEVHTWIWMHLAKGRHSPEKLLRCLAVHAMEGLHSRILKDARHLGKDIRTADQNSLLPD
jgi:hypothetical protein